MQVLVSPMMNVAASLLPCDDTLMVSSFVLGLNELSSVMTSVPSVRTVLQSVVGKISSGSLQMHGIVVVAVELVGAVTGAVELVGAVVGAIELVGSVTGAIELVGASSAAVVNVTVELEVQSETIDAVAPKRSVLMNFMQSANDPTVSELMHSFFILLASLDASVISLQSVSGSGASHSFKGLVF